MEPRYHIPRRLSKITLIMELIILALTFTLLAGLSLKAQPSENVSSANIDIKLPASVYESKAPGLFIPSPMEGVAPFGYSESE